jgi:hypothetical protein
VKAFSALPFLMMSLASQKQHPFIADFTWGNIKISWSQVRRVWGMRQCFHVVLC